MGAPWYPPTGLERLNSSVCKRREHLWPAQGNIYGQITNPWTWGFGVSAVSGGSEPLACRQSPRGRWGRVCVTCSEPPTVGSALGSVCSCPTPRALPSLWHRPHPLLVLHPQVAGDADRVPQDQQAEPEEEEEGRAPNSSGNPRGDTPWLGTTTLSTDTPQNHRGGRGLLAPALHVLSQIHEVPGGARRGAGRSRASSAEAGRNSSGLRLPPWR